MTMAKSLAASFTAKRALFFSKRALCSLKRALYSFNRALFPLQEALYCLKRALFAFESAHFSFERAYLSFKRDPVICQKSCVFYQKSWQCIKRATSYDSYQKSHAFKCIIYHSNVSCQKEPCIRMYHAPHRGTPRVWCIVLHTILHCVALRCTALHCVALCCTALHCADMDVWRGVIGKGCCTELHCSALYWVALHCTVLRWSDVDVSVRCDEAGMLRCIAVCCAALRCGDMQRERERERERDDMHSLTCETCALTCTLSHVRQMWKHALSLSLSLSHAVETCTFGTVRWRRGVNVTDGTRWLIWECTATHCNTLQHAATHWDKSQGCWCYQWSQMTHLGASAARMTTVIGPSVLQHVTACHSVLQCVAVCCSVLQCVAV